MCLSRITVQNVALINKSKERGVSSVISRDVTCYAPGASELHTGLPHRHSGGWGQMSAAADVHQYLAASIPDRQQLRARVGVRLAFKPDCLNRSLSEASSHSDEKFSAVRSNAWFVSDGKVLIANRPLSHHTEPRLQPFRAKTSQHSQNKSFFFFFLAKCHWFNL